MGIADVDPFIMGLTQAAGTALRLASSGIVIAAASNTLVKGIYAYCLAQGRGGASESRPLARPGGLGPPASSLVSLRPPHPWGRSTSSLTNVGLSLATGSLRESR
jgi:hypothetical protein